MHTQSDYCRDRAAPAGSNVYYALLFEHKESKDKILPVFALHYEITACLTASADPGVTRMKLQWWSEELTRLNEAIPQHPITLSLQAIINRTSLPSIPLRDYLEVINIIIARESIATMDEWFAKLTGGLGQIWGLASGLSTHSDPLPDTLIQSNGGTIFLLELIQNLGLFISRGYMFLPGELLDAHGYNRYEFADGKDEGARALLRVVIDKLESHLDDCYAALLNNKRGLPYYPLIMNRLAKSTCIEIRRDGYQLLKHKIALTPIRKLWIATRTRYHK